MCTLYNKHYITAMPAYLDTYLKNKPADCVLYSEDGTEFKIRKELLSQTKFLRKILSSAKDHCCNIIEILCPCSKEELGTLVEFLYNGKMICDRKMWKFNGFRVVEILTSNTSEFDIDTLKKIIYKIALTWHSTNVQSE